MKNSGRMLPPNPDHREERLKRDRYFSSQLEGATIDSSPTSGQAGRAGQLRHEERLYMEQGSHPSLKPGIGAARYHELPRSESKDEIWAKAAAKARQADHSATRISKGPKPNF